MVILSKSWIGNIVVKLFTTIGVNLLRHMLRIFRNIPEEFLGIVPRKFPGIGSEELLVGNYQEFSQILSTFSLVYCRIGNKKFTGIGYKKFLG